MSGSGVAYALNIKTCLGDASKHVESHGGTTNVAPDRAT